MKLKIENQRIEIIETELFVSNTVNVYRVTFEFDESWDGYQPVAVFECRDGRHTEAREVVIVDNSAIIPWETLLPGGTLRIGVYGTRDGQRLPTVYTPGQYVSRGAEGAEEGTEATPGALEQVLNIIGDLSDLETEDKTTLVNAINEAAESGGGGTAAQPDYNQNDSTAADYIKNRPFYMVEDIVLPEMVLSGKSDTISPQIDLIIGKAYRVYLDGDEFDAVCESEFGSGYAHLYVRAEDGSKYVTVYEFQVTGTKGVALRVTQVREIKTLPEYFLPDMTKYITRETFDSAFFVYITDIDTLIGGDA